MLDLFRLAALGVVLSCTACAHHSMPPPGGPTVDVLVKGVPASLIAFNQALQPTIATHAIGCVRCDQLGATPPPDSVTYSFFSNQSKLYARFGAAWDGVPGVKPEMTFFAPTPISPGCSAKPACYNLSPCLQYGRCTTDPTPAPNTTCKGPCL
jgi:hypothetical protein